MFTKVVCRILKTCRFYATHNLLIYWAFQLVKMKL